MSSVLEIMCAFSRKTALQVAFPTTSGNLFILCFHKVSVFMLNIRVDTDFKNTVET